MEHWPSHISLVTLSRPFLHIALIFISLASPRRLTSRSAFLPTNFDFDTSIVQNVFDTFIFSFFSHYVAYHMVCLVLASFFFGARDRFCGLAGALVRASASARARYLSSSSHRPEAGTGLEEDAGHRGGHCQECEGAEDEAWH